MQCLALQSFHSVIPAAAGEAGLDVSDVLFEMCHISGVRGKECISEEGIYDVCTVSCYQRCVVRQEKQRTSALFNDSFYIFCTPCLVTDNT